VKNYVRYSALAYLIFVIYGSLVPLDFNFIPLNIAWQRFENIRYLNLGIGSRADWVANILLFIPLAFLWMGVLTGNKNFWGKIFASIIVALFCFFLCFSIEFTQLFFPPRTVSQNDIIAECLGAFIGILVWWLVGDKAVAKLEQWRVSDPSSNTDYYLQIYLASLFFYNVMPLDLTLSPVEFFHKWNEGRIILIPFGGLKVSFVENLYEWISELILWIPVPLLWVRRSQFSLYQLWIRCFSAAVLIEVFQLFVYSRVTDVTDILLALFGSGIGLWGGRYFSSEASAEKQHYVKILKKNSLLIGGAGYLGWSLVLIFVFWYPFEFQVDRELVQLRLKGLFDIPFYAYYYGTEFRAVTEVLHKTLFFMPLGFVLVFIDRSLGYRQFFWMISVFALAVTCGVIEIAQALLPDKVVSSTDIILTGVGGYMGYRVGKSFFYRAVSITNIRKSESIDVSKIDHKVEGGAFSRQAILIGLLLNTGVLYLASQSSFVPYNIRELVSGEYALLNAFGLSLSVLWCLAFPVYYLSFSIKTKRNPLLCFFYGIGIHSFFAWFLIRLSAPLESIHDIVGSPILSLFAELEIFFRFFALFSVFSLALFGSILIVITTLGLDEKFLRYFIALFFVSLIVLPLGYWVVVIEAATDNLTELMVDGGYSYTVIGLFFYMLLFSYVGSRFASFFVLRSVWMVLRGVGALLISFPLGYWLLNLATESFIFKYGAVFSALQFLLSPDRVHLLSEDDLFFRFCMAHSLLILLVCLVQVSFWRNLSRIRMH